MAATFKEEHKKLLVSRTNAKLLTVNSPTNTKQIQKEMQRDFIELVNSHLYVFSNLATVLSGDLQRHFLELSISDKDKLAEETRKIDLNFLKNAFSIMEINVNTNFSRAQAVFLYRLAEILGLDLATFSTYLDLNYSKVKAQLAHIKPNEPGEMRLKSSGLAINFFSWRQLRYQIFQISIVNSPILIQLKIK